MKTSHFQKIVLILPLTVIIAACSAAGGTPTSPPPVASEPAAAETMPAAAPTTGAEQAPTDVEPTAIEPTTVEPTVVEATAAEPTLPPTLPPTAEAPAATETLVTLTETSVATPPSGLGFLPQEGQWGGGDRELILSFVIGRQAGQATIGDIGLLWFGQRDECTLNHRLTDITVIQGSDFTRRMVLSDMSYILIGKLISPTLMEGTFDLSYKGCADKLFNWRAIPKPATP